MPIPRGSERKERYRKSQWAVDGPFTLSEARSFTQWVNRKSSRIVLQCEGQPNE